MRPEFVRTRVEITATADITRPNRRAGGVLHVDPVEYLKLEKFLAPVMDAFITTAHKVTVDGWPLAAAVLGIPPEIECILPNAWLPWSGDLVRIDFILSGGIPAVIEANFGAAVGGSIDAEAFARAAPWLPQLVPNTERIRWASRKARSMGFTSLFLPHWPWSHILDSAAYFAGAVRAAEAEGVELRVVELEEFMRLRTRERSPRVALRMFATLDAIRYGTDLNALGYFPGSEVIWLQSEEVAVLSNKAIMAHRAFREMLLPAAAGTVPPAWIISSNPVEGFENMTPSDALGSQRNLVFKPTSDHGGSGVLLGVATPRERWKVAVGTASTTPALVQRFLPTDEVAFENINVVTGARDSFSGPVSYGAYFVERRMVGVLARVGSPSMRGTPINGGTGAALTALLPGA